MIFQLGDFITARMRASVFRSSTYSCYFKVKEKEGGGGNVSTNMVLHSTYNTEQTALIHNT